MSKYRFIFDKSRKKYVCPGCGEIKLVRFRDAQTNELQPEEFGRCDREDNCKYFKYPSREDFKYENFSRSKLDKSKFTTKPEVRQTYIPWDSIIQTFAGYDDCSFFKYFSNKGFPDELVEKVIEMYYLGTIQSGYLRGALTIPYINVNDEIAFVQVKLFNSQNNTIKTNALHSILKGTPNNDWINDFEKNERKITCFFGAHLIKKYPNNPIALVEAPKTAIYCSLYYGLPTKNSDFLWIAVFNKSALSSDRFKDLEGRNITIFPDLSMDSLTFNDWKLKAKSFEKLFPGTTISISTYLEEIASEEQRRNGEDLADILSNFTYNEFLDNFKGVKSVKNDAENKSFFNDEPEAVEESPEDNLLDLLKGQKSYTIGEIETIFMDGAGINREDANYCFHFLYNDNALKKTSHNEYYYLATSTPF